jgi:proteasome beta subunit
VEGSFDGIGVGQPAAFMTARVSSFTEFLAGYAPDLLPIGFRGRGLPAGADGLNEVIKSLPHATTIVAAACEHGVVMAGDRRATAGNMIIKRDVDKVLRSDEFSAIGIAGTASIGLEFIRLFQVELEHYEKMEGRSLTLEGKAHRLAKMVRDNLGAAMQGLAAVPLFVGYDEESGTGRIFSYDVAGSSPSPR